MEPKKRIKGKHQNTDWGHGVKQVRTLKKARKSAPQQGPELQIAVDDAAARGTYTNAANISHSGTEFVLDFLFLQAGRPRAKVHTRVISSPKHLKRFAAALAENIKKYEERFGSIRDSRNPR